MDFLVRQEKTIFDDAIRWFQSSWADRAKEGCIVRSTENSIKFYWNIQVDYEDLFKVSQFSVDWAFSGKVILH